MTDRIRDVVRAKVRYWIAGPGVRFPGDPLQEMILTGPSWPTFRSLQTFPGEGSPVKIGRYSGLHYTATVVQGGEHRPDWVGLAHAHLEDGVWVKTEDSVFDRGQVVIGNDVWVGYEALIMSGVEIGDGAIIGARSVVRRSVEPYQVVGGNPARMLGWRFDEETRNALLRIKWWDWSDEKVAAHSSQIDSADVAGFVGRHDPDLGPPTCSLCVADAPGAS